MLSDIQFLQMTGRDRAHLCPVVCGSSSFQLTFASAAAFQGLVEAARQAGFGLAIASAHRDFERQLSIWNAKASGQRPVLGNDGKPLDIDSLTERQRVFAILRWSALPGASRHHWGSDLDIYDAAAVSPAYQVQLSSDETTGEGVFAGLHCWLDARIDAGEAFGFYRPYRADRGGVAPEPWHLSFAPESRQFQRQMDPARYYDFLSAQRLALRQAVLDHFEEIYHRFIEPVDVRARFILSRGE
jgi:LAS superfamily LD-carboxypeptidase LdcB